MPGKSAYLSLQVLDTALQLCDVGLHLTLALLCGESLPHAKGDAALIQCLTAVQRMTGMLLSGI